MYSVFCQESSSPNFLKTSWQVNETLSCVTQHAEDRKFAKQIASPATESKTNFQLSPTAVKLTVWHKSWPSRIMLNDAMFYIQPFRQRSHKSEYKSVKAYATKPIWIMGSKSDWVSRWFGNKEGESINTRVCAASFHHAETPQGSIKQP